MASRISKRTVDAAHPLGDGKRYIVWDRTLHGFGLLVLPSGVKSFIYNYRNAHGTKRRATIAKVGTLTPDQAREHAADMAAMVKAGGDPLAAKQERRQAATVGEILDAYLASERFKSKAESTKAVDKGRIERHLRPLLGNKHVDALTTEDVRRAYAAIRDGKTACRIKTVQRGLARVTGGAGTARKAIRLLRAILAWAIEDRRASTNPAVGVNVGTDGERETILDEPGQYGRLFSTLATMETERRIRSPVADAIRIIALTGARCGEITGLRWRHVNLKTGTIVLPDAAHKTGKKTGRPRVISLPAVAQEIVARQPAGEPDSHVFQSAKGIGTLSLARPWRAVRVEAGVYPKVSDFMGYGTRLHRIWRWAGLKRPRSWLHWAIVSYRLRRSMFIGLKARGRHLRRKLRPLPWPGLLLRRAIRLPRWLA